jgi:hypothetical protein
MNSEPGETSEEVFITTKRPSMDLGSEEQQPTSSGSGTGGGIGLGEELRKREERKPLGERADSADPPSTASSVMSGSLLDSGWFDDHFHLPLLTPTIATGIQEDDTFEVISPMRSPSGRKITKEGRRVSFAPTEDTLVLEEEEKPRPAEDVTQVNGKMAEREKEEKAKG